MRKRKTKRSPAQQAASKHAWRILQLRGAMTFLRSLKLHEDLLTAVETMAEKEIESLQAADVGGL